MGTFSKIDMAVFDFINQRLGDPTLDFVMSTLSSSFIWGGVASLFVLYALRTRSVPLLSCIVALIVGITLADVICFEVLKPFFARIRPCHDPLVVVKILNGGCGGQFGMPSNHAANGMTVAVLGWMFMGRQWGVSMVFLATAVGVSRVYLGVHYPSDVLVGWLLGPVFAFPTRAIANRIFVRIQKGFLKFS